MTINEEAILEALGSDRLSVSLLKALLTDDEGESRQIQQGLDYLVATRLVRSYEEGGTVWYSKIRLTGDDVFRALEGRTLSVGGLANQLVGNDTAEIRDVVKIAIDEALASGCVSGGLLEGGPPGVVWYWRA